MEAELERVAPGFRERVVGRHVAAPPDLEAANANLVGGAINGGTAQLHQQLVLRPFPGLGRAGTAVPRLFLASASAHPGGGVHGACGANAARAALRTRWTGDARRRAAPSASAGPHEQLHVAVGAAAALRASPPDALRPVALRVVEGQRAAERRELGRREAERAARAPARPPGAAESRIVPNSDSVPSRLSMTSIVRLCCGPVDVRGGVDLPEPAALAALKKSTRLAWVWPAT